jgi:hypothetical protein
MEYQGMNPNQYKRVVYIAKKFNIKTCDVVDDVAGWCKCFQDLDDVINWVFNIYLVEVLK